MDQDCITLTGLQVMACHGVLPEEKTTPQPFSIDVVLWLSLASAASSDDLHDTVSYADVADRVEEVFAAAPRDLIETLAQESATATLSTDSRIEQVKITVHKPQAPITQRFSDVSVTITRHRDTRRSETIQQQDPEAPPATGVRAVLALGSNLGESRATLASARAALNAAEGIELIQVSPLARTSPVGGPEGQPDFLNQVVEIYTWLSPHDLLDLAQQVEADHNRIRIERWGPRTLDVDIVTYGDYSVDSPRLQVPHPSAAGRAFVLTPWSWMDPGARLQGEPVSALAQRAEDSAEVLRVPEQMADADPEESTG